MQMKCPQFSCMENEDLLFQERTILYKVALIDGMAALQTFEIDKAQNCCELARNFVSHLKRKCTQYDEIFIIFDRYDLENSLKEATRKSRLCGQTPTYYKITDATPTRKMKMKNLLSHDKSKDELTVYLSKKHSYHCFLQRYM